MCPTVLISDLTSDLSITTKEVTFFSSATLFTYGLMQLPSGLLADAFGGKKTIILLSILAGLSTLVFAFSSNLSVMTISRVITGLSIAVTVPALVLLAHHFSARMYGRATSILLSCGGLGSILAAPPLIALSSAFGWRYAMAFFGVLILVIAILIAVFVPKDSAEFHKKKVSVKDSLLGVKKVFSSLQFWPLALWAMFTIGTHYMLASFWWGPYIMDGAGFSKKEVGIILTVAALTLVICQPLLGYCSDVIFKARKIPLFVLSILGTISSFAMVLFTGEMTFPMLIVQTVFLIFGIALGSSVVFTMVKESFPLNIAGTATGCMTMLYPIWAAILQIVFGKVYTWALINNSPSQAMKIASWIIVANCVAAVIACFFMKETFAGKASEPSGVV